MGIRTYAASAAMLVFFALPALATVGGPDLADCLGWEPDSQVVYFRIIGVDESGDAPTIVRLRLNGSRRFEPLWWSVHTVEDSTYKKRLGRVRRSLKPLREMPWTSVAENFAILSSDTTTMYFQTWHRYRVRASWFNGVCEGGVEATTYREPSLRLLRFYPVPGGDESIGVFSYIGLPTESGYEVQVPILIPRDRDTVVVLKDLRPRP